MHKIIRSLLFKSPQIYKLGQYIKNNYLLGFYFKKVHEPDFNAFKLICESRPQVFLDIGANAGMSALSFFTLKPNSEVISFEPNPINYPYLDKLSNKFKDFKYMGLGLGDRLSSIDFYYPVYNGKEMTTLGSCNYEQAKGWINPDSIYFFDPDKLKIEKITIEVKTLDSFGFEPEFVKIDVEGFEYQVLLGSEKTVKNHRPIFLIEGAAEGDKVHRLLQAWGYDVYKFYKDKFYKDRFDCSNNFFVPREKTQLIQPYFAS